MNVIDIISVISIILIPIFAVCLGQYLQDRVSIRNEKVEVFKNLMFYRNLGYTDMEPVKNLNLVPILFIKNKKIMESYNEYVDIANKKSTMIDYFQKLEQSKKSLLEEMAKELGYKQINWKIIENSYLPKETIDQKDMAMQLLTGMSSFFVNENFDKLISQMQEEFKDINKKIDKLDEKKEDKRP